MNHENYKTEALATIHDLLYVLYRSYSDPQDLTDEIASIRANLFGLEQRIRDLPDD